MLPRIHQECALFQLRRTAGASPWREPRDRESRTWIACVRPFTPSVIKSGLLASRDTETEGNALLWWLGNSLNSAGTRRYPLFAAEVPGQQRIEFAEYVRLLGEGNVPGRPEAEATTHFTNRWTYDPPAPVTQHHPELQAFPGWERVLTILGSVAGVRVDTSGEPAINECIEALRTCHILADNRPHPSWSVPDERRSQVAAHLADLLRDRGSQATLIVDLATWAYHGGVQGGELSLSYRTVARVLRVAHNEIERTAASDESTWSFESRTFEDSIDRALRKLDEVTSVIR